MPTAVLKKFAKKSGKSLDKVEEYWKEAVKSAKESDAKTPYAYATGIVKKRLGITESKFENICESILSEGKVSALQALKAGGFVVTDSIPEEKRSWLEMKESAKLSKELEKKKEAIKKRWHSGGDERIDLDEVDKLTDKLDKEYEPKFKAFRKSVKDDAIKALKKAGIKFKLAGSEIFGDDFALSFSSQVVVLKRKPSKAFRAGIDE